MSAWPVRLMLHAALVAAQNGLLTADQSRLDATAKRIAASGAFSDLRTKALTQYKAVLQQNGALLDNMAVKDLEIAVDELVYSSVQKAVNDDASRPAIYWVNSAPRGDDVPGGRYSYDNPDNIYRIMPVNSTHEYLLQGIRYGAGPSDSSFSLISNPNSQQTVSYLSGNDLNVSASGEYTILLSSNASRAASAQNFLLAKDTGVQLYIRNNIGDWNTELPDKLSVRVIDNAASQPAPTDADIVAKGRVALGQSTLFYGIGALGLKTFSNPVNTFSKPEQSASLGTLTTQASSFGHYLLQQDQAFVITISPGVATYWVVPLTTLGIITVDPAETVTSFNSKQALPNSNGTFTIILTENDPGVHNWIPLAGRTQGTLMIRFQGLPPAGESHGGLGVSSSVVPLAQLDAFLPEGTPYIDECSRNYQVQRRAEGYARIRFGN